MWPMRPCAGPSVRSRRYSRLRPRPGVGGRMGEGRAGQGRPLIPLWLSRHEATTPRPTCWLALGELVGSTLAPSPGPWAWTPCTFIGVSGCGACVLGLGGHFGRHPTLSLCGPCPPRHSGLLSALGLALADVVHEAQEPCSLPYAPETFVQLDQRLSRLEEQCVDALRAQGFPRWGSGGCRARWRACHVLAASLGASSAAVREGWTRCPQGYPVRVPCLSPLQGPDQH